MSKKEVLDHWKGYHRYICVQGAEQSQPPLTTTHNGKNLTPVQEAKGSRKSGKDSFIPKKDEIKKRKRRCFTWKQKKKSKGSIPISQYDVSIDDHPDV